MVCHETLAVAWPIVANARTLVLTPIGAIPVVAVVEGLRLRSFSDLPDGLLQFQIDSLAADLLKKIQTPKDVEPILWQHINTSR